MAAASPVVHMLYVFDKAGTCLYYQEWSRKRNLLADQPEEDQKLMFGMLFSFKHLCKQMSTDKDTEDGISLYKTGTYHLHHLEVPTGYHFVLVTNTAVHDAAATLAAIYRQAFVPYVVCNPLQARGAPVANPAFVRMVDKTVAEVALG